MAEDIIDEIAGVEEEESGQEAPEEEASPTEEPEEKAEGEEREPTRVPVGVLQEERSRRQELQAELRETRDKMAKMEALFERFQTETRQKDAPPEEQIPAYEDDPEGHLRARLDRAERLLSESRQEAESRKEREQGQSREQELMEQYASAVRRFQSETPDFSDAYAFLEKSRDEELKMLGFTDPRDREYRLRYEEGQIVGRMLATGTDPAKALYEYAKKRGYKAGDEEKLDRLEKGTNAATTLTGPKGSKASATTLEALAELEGAEFDEAWEKARKAGLLG